LKKIHVLLVEDNEADIELTRETLGLNALSIKLSVAKDGVEALAFLNSAGSWSEPGQPTLILLDLNLPRTDGRQVLAVIKAHDELRRIPVVVLSSSDSERDVANCYHLGANCYMVKPLDLKSYRSIIRKLEDYWLGAATLPRRDGHSSATQIGQWQ
jgi:two-component system, chemotaxis family, response regulator Rcp1